MMTNCRSFHCHYNYR